MNIANAFSTLSLAVAIVGGAFMLTPSTSHAGNSGFISNPALGHNNIPCSVRNGTSNNCRVGKPANPPPKIRPCLKIQKCRG
ncbi:MAG: rapid alkalinization factor family protein [Fibrobacteria bacterium]